MKLDLSAFDEFPVLKTARLTLRDIRVSDAAQLFEMRSNGRVNQFIARPDMVALTDAEQLAERTRQAYSNRQAIGWAGILRENQEIIGTCGFNQFDVPNLRAEIGGELSVGYWGKNIALEAVAAILRFGLEHMQLHSVEAKVSPGNRGAIGLLERLGFRKEAHFTDRVYFGGRFTDLAVYTLIRGQERLDV